jgi:C4-dicarboxylate-binding protein DctP
MTMNTALPATYFSISSRLPVPSRRSVVQWMAVAALGCAAVGSVCAAAATPIIIQFSHVVKPDTAKGKAALRFKQLAEARTGGRVRVEVYPDSQLYKDREELDALRLGAVQMLAPSLSKLAGLGGDDFLALDLPFLFKDRAAYRAVVDGPAGAALLKKLEPRGIKGLTFWDNGFKVFTANRPLQTVADFKGLRIRVQASKVLVAQMRALGSVAPVSPLIDVRADLQAGKLDGQENTPTNIQTQGLHEVQSHLTISNHGYLAYAVIVNQLFWEKLPADIRANLESAMRDATSYENSIAEADNLKALDRLTSGGQLITHTITPQEAAQWRTAMQPVYREARQWISPEMLAALPLPQGAPP